MLCEVPQPILAFRAKVLRDASIYSVFRITGGSVDCFQIGCRRKVLQSICIMSCYAPDCINPRTTPLVEGDDRPLAISPEPDDLMGIKNVVGYLVGTGVNV